MLYARHALTRATWIHVARVTAQFVVATTLAVAQEPAPAPITYVADIERRLPPRNDLFGFSLENLGDLDGDGLGGPGQVFLLSGRTGRTLRVLEAAEDPPSRPVASATPRAPRPPNPRTSNRWDSYGCTFLGFCVVALGDHDGDGEEEIAIGAPGAWTADGRTGAVLIVGARSRRLLRTMAGDEHDGGFGLFLEAVPDARGSSTKLLGARVNGTMHVFDPRDGGLVREEVPADEEGSIGFDVDGDGVEDFLRDPCPGESELVVVSGTRTRELLRLPLDLPWGEHVRRYASLAGDFDADGRKDLAVLWPAPGASRIFLFSGTALRNRIAIDLENPVDGLLLYNCGDLDQDGREDVLAARPHSLEQSLTCYSGATGRKVWTNVGVLDAEMPSVDRLQDLDGDGIPEVITGKVRFYWPGGFFDGSGTVFILSGKSGGVLVELDEADFPTISHASYLASFAK